MSSFKLCSSLLSAFFQSTCCTTARPCGQSGGHTSWRMPWTGLVPGCALVLILCCSGIAWAADGQAQAAGAAVAGAQTDAGSPGKDADVQPPAETNARTNELAKTPDNTPGAAAPAAAGQRTEADTAAAGKDAAGQKGQDKTGQSKKQPEGKSDGSQAKKAEEAAPDNGQKDGQDDGQDVDSSVYDPKAVALWPDVDKLVTAPFGEYRGSRVPLLSTSPMRPRYHSGLDIRGHLGWPVRSLQNGKVIQCGPAGNAGLMVKVAQDDKKTVSYAHLGSILVKKGQRVTRGQHVGTVGCTGRTTGAHLHITVRDVTGKHIDPRKEIRGMWEVYDPPLADLEKPIGPQACRGRGVNKRLLGQQQYLRMRKALIDSGSYDIPDISRWEDRAR